MSDLGSWIWQSAGKSRGQIAGEEEAVRLNYAFPNDAGVAKLADAQDLKSWDSKESCGFDSHPRHQARQRVSAGHWSRTLQFRLAHAGQSPARTFALTHKVKKNEVRRQSSRVRELLAAWDPLPDSPPDEYDCLVDHVVSALHRGANASTLAKLIEDEFRDHFGSPVDPAAALSLAERIGEW